MNACENESTSETQIWGEGSKAPGVGHRHANTPVFRRKGDTGVCEAGRQKARITARDGGVVYKEKARER